MCELIELEHKLRYGSSRLRAVTSEIFNLMFFVKSKFWLAFLGDCGHRWHIFLSSATLDSFGNEIRNKSSEL